MKNTHIILIIFLFCFLFKKSKSKENFTDETSTCTLKKAYWESTFDSLGKPCTPNVGKESQCGNEHWCLDTFDDGNGICHARNTDNYYDRHSCNPQKENSCPQDFNCILSKTGKSFGNESLGVCVKKNSSGNFSGAYCGKDNDCKGLDDLTCNDDNICEKKLHSLPPEGMIEPDRTYKPPPIKDYK